VIFPWRISAQNIHFLIVFPVLLLVGCQSEMEGPSRYTLSGTATYAGKPIPFGRILLQPDAEKGNQGPAGVAEIANGKFETRSGKGHVGGPHRITIIATDGSRPKSADVDNSLFPPFEMEMTLPPKNSTHDFSVPSSAAKNSL